MPNLAKKISQRLTQLKRVGASFYFFEFRSLLFLVSGKPHIQVMTVKRNFAGNGNYYRWLKKTHPQYFARLRFTVATAPFSNPLPTAEGLIHWIATTSQIKTPTIKQWLIDNENEFLRRELPIINRIEAIDNTCKEKALRIIASTGILTAKTICCDKTTSYSTLVNELGLPFLVRSNRRHSRPIFKIERSEDLEKVEWEALEETAASTYIDTQCDDGFYRKYRYVLWGNRGINRHVILSPHWWQHAPHRSTEPIQRTEEEAFYKATQPYHHVLNEARKALGLDFVGLDYSLTKEGQLIVWEPNATPVIWSAPLNYKGRLDYSLKQSIEIFKFMTEEIFKPPETKV